MKVSSNELNNLLRLLIHLIITLSGEIVRLKVAPEKATDSGVSVTSEPPDDLTIVKHERFTSDDDDEMASNTSERTKANTHNNSKRKLDFDDDDDDDDDIIAPSTSKKIKTEPQSGDEKSSPVKVKQEKPSEDETIDADLEELLGLSKKSKKKKKKSSRKSANFDDELNKLLNSV